MVKPSKGWAVSYHPFGGKTYRLQKKNSSNTSASPPSLRGGEGGRIDLKKRKNHLHLIAEGSLWGERRIDSKKKKIVV